MADHGARTLTSRLSGTSINSPHARGSSAWPACKWNVAFLVVSVLGMVTSTIAALALGRWYTYKGCWDDCEIVYDVYVGVFSYCALPATDGRTDYICLPWSEWDRDDSTQYQLIKNAKIMAINACWLSCLAAIAGLAALCLAHNQVAWTGKITRWYTMLFPGVVAIISMSLFASFISNSTLPYLYYGQGRFGEGFVLAGCTAGFSLMASITLCSLHKQQRTVDEESALL